MFRFKRALRNAILIALVISAWFLEPAPAAPDMQIDIAGPPGSGSFGLVALLPNGNFVVTDPYYDLGTTADVGAAYLFAGADGQLISMLTGSTAGDHVGNRVTVLSNGNYVVYSRYWDNGVVVDAGAVTWGDGANGISGVVSSANSLVGSHAGDLVGEWDVIPLSNGNYVVSSYEWDNGAVVDAGAVTWGNGATGTSGVVSPLNSLVGSTAGDHIGKWPLTPLTNGNYVVSSFEWDNGAVVDAGAVTWGDGTTGISGVISPLNSLVGSTAEDMVGFGWVTSLSNGNYVVSSLLWDNGADVDVGAVTWGDGATGISGVVSPLNSLVGSTAGDHVGDWPLTPLTNGNYVVRSPYWDNGSVVDAGAATWGDGTTGTSGVVSPLNSLVGSHFDDMVGGYYVTPLSNGNYVVSSYHWDNGWVADAGAVTWGDGATGTSGVVSPANSLVGSHSGDQVDSYVTSLSNGNYVVSNIYWDNGAVVDAGAVTWGDGATGTSGVVSPLNSLVGSTAGDWVGWVTSLSNGNYVVGSPEWDNAAVVDAGAVTWGDGATGISGVVSTANSLVGSHAGDGVGYVTPLSNGNYVVSSILFDNRTVVDAGAATWGDGATGTSGVLSPLNSLVGGHADDWVGLSVTPLSNGNYVVGSGYWDNGAIVDAGAATWGDGTSGTTGLIGGLNSVCGATAGGGYGMNHVYNPTYDWLIVGRPGDNIVSLFRFTPPKMVYLPLVAKSAAP